MLLKVLEDYVLFCHTINLSTIHGYFAEQSVMNAKVGIFNINLNVPEIQINTSSSLILKINIDLCNHWPNFFVILSPCLVLCNKCVMCVDCSGGL